MDIFGRHHSVHCSPPSVPCNDFGREFFKMRRKERREEKEEEWTTSIGFYFIDLFFQLYFINDNTEALREFIITWDLIICVRAKTRIQLA